MQTLSSLAGKRGLPVWRLVTGTSCQLPECVVSGGQLCSAVKMQMVSFAMSTYIWHLSLDGLYKVSPTLGHSVFSQVAQELRTMLLVFWFCFVLFFSTQDFVTFLPNLVILMQGPQRKRSAAFPYIKCSCYFLFWVKDLTAETYAFVYSPSHTAWHIGT